MAIELKRTSPTVTRTVDTGDGPTSSVPVFPEGTIKNVDGAMYAKWYIPQLVDDNKIRLFRNSDQRGVSVVESAKSFNIHSNFDVPDTGDLSIVNRLTSNKLANIFTQTTPAQQSIYVWFDWANGSIRKQLNLSYSDASTDIKYFSQYKKHLYVLVEILSTWYVHYYFLDNFPNKSTVPTPTYTLTVTTDKADILAGENYLYLYTESGGNPVIELRPHGDIVVDDTWTNPLLGDALNQYPVHMMEIDDLDIYLRQLPSTLFRITNGTSVLQSNDLDADTGDFRIMNYKEIYLETGSKLITPYESYSHVDKWYKQGGIAEVGFNVGHVMYHMADYLEIPQGFIDNNDVLNVEVDGLKLDSEYTGQGVVELLRTALFLDYRDDGILSPLSRTNALDRVVNFDINYAGCYVANQPQYQDSKNVEYQKESEIPNAVTITYAATESDYIERSQNIFKDAGGSKRFLNLELRNFAFTDDQAIQICDKTMAVAELERIDKMVITNFLYFLAQAGDFFLFSDETDYYRIANLTLNPFPPIINLQLKLDDVSIYDSEVNGSPGDAQTIEVPLFPDFVLLDLPLLQDDTFVDDYGYYLASEQIGDDYPEANLWKNITGSWEEEIDLQEASAIGQTETLLPDHTWKLVDYVNTLRIKLNDSTKSLTSCTDAEFYDHTTNLLAIYNDSGIEIIKFQNSSEVVSGTYDIDTFIRGYLGTENATGLHTRADNVIVLDNLIRTVTPVDEDGDYIAIPDETVFPKADPDDEIYELTQNFNNTQRLLQPYSVVDLDAEKDGNDIIISGINRGRYGNDAWHLFIDLLETDTSINQIDIYNDTDNVVRTIESEGLPVTYTEAQQVSDFGSVQTDIKIAVYQSGRDELRGVAAELEKSF